MRPETKADFIVAVDEAMHFPTLPNGYRFSVDDGEIFYKALSDYVECFRDVLEFLSFDLA